MSRLGRESMDILDAARTGDDPLPEDRARVRRRLAQLGVGAAVTTAASSTAAAASSALGQGTAGTGALSAGGASMAGAAATAGASTFGALVLKMAATILVVGGVGAAGAKGLSAYRAHGAAAAEPRAATVAVAPPASAAAPVSLTAPLGPPAVPGVAAALPVDPPVVAVPEPMTVAPAVVVARTAGPPRPTTLNATPAAAPPAVEDSTAEETRLLRAADAARKSGDAVRSLALLEEHAARFPKGVLAEERAALRVPALCALGRVTEARAERQAFLAATPRAPEAALVRGTCAPDTAR